MIISAALLSSFLKEVAVGLNNYAARHRTSEGYVLFYSLSSLEENIHPLTALVLWMEPLFLE